MASVPACRRPLSNPALAQACSAACLGPMMGGMTMGGMTMGGMMGGMIHSYQPPQQKPSGTSEPGSTAYFSANSRAAAGCFGASRRCTRQQQQPASRQVAVQRQAEAVRHCLLQPACSHLGSSRVFMSLQIMHMSPAAASKQVAVQRQAAAGRYCLLQLACTQPGSSQVFMSLQMTSRASQRSLLSANYHSRSRAAQQRQAAVWQQQPSSSQPGSSRVFWSLQMMQAAPAAASRQVAVQRQAAAVRHCLLQPACSHLGSSRVFMSLQMMRASLAAASKPSSCRQVAAGRCCLLQPACSHLGSSRVRWSLRTVQQRY
jgi:hypothetical protein